MHNNRDIFAVLHLSLKSVLLMGFLFLVKPVLSIGLHPSSFVVTPGFKQQTPQNNPANQPFALLCAETMEDSEDEEGHAWPLVPASYSTFLVCYWVDSHLPISQPMPTARHGRIPLYILFHAWKGFSC